MGLGGQLSVKFTHTQMVCAHGVKIKYRNGKGVMIMGVTTLVTMFQHSTYRLIKNYKYAK